MNQTLIDPRMIAGYAGFDTVAALQADTRLRNWGGTGGRQIADGAPVRAGRFSYRATALDASDYHLVTAGGLRVYVEPPDFDVAAFGLATGASAAANTAILERVVPILRAAGVKTMAVDSGTYALDRDGKFADMVFVGNGAFTGPDLDVVHRRFEGSFTVPRTIDPDRHLRAFSRAAAPVVVIVGDSLSTNTPGNTSDEADSYWGHLQRAIRAANPGRTVTFHNRGIGSATWKSFNRDSGAEMTIGLPSWFTDTGRSWADYVEDLSPDLVIFNFGMNDNNTFVNVQMKAGLGRLALFDKVPDVILTTNLIPSRQSDNTGVGTPDRQTGAYLVGGYQRQYARRNGLGYVDLTRQCSVLRNGMDPWESHFDLVVDAEAIDLPHTFTDQRCSDFTMELGFTATGSFFTDRRLRLDLSQPFDGVDSWIDIYDDGGFLAVELSDDDNPAGKYTTVTSAVATPSSGAQTLTVTVKDDFIRVMLGTAEVYEGPTLRFGGMFEPRVVWTDDSTTGFTATLWRGRWLQYMPQITDAEIWGDGDDDTGNDLNHPTSYGAGRVYGAALANQDWGGSRNLVSGRVQAGIPIPPMADESTYTIPLTGITSGRFHLMAADTRIGAIVDFNAGAGTVAVGMSVLGTRTALAAAGTDLTGTTGANDRLTISIKEGAIELENQATGSTVNNLRYFITY